jgi:SAM-dependent methyltransferase
MLSPEHGHLVQALYVDTAPRYAAHIAPMLRPLAAGLVRDADLHPTDYVLDIGSGTGVVAAVAAPHAHRVAAADVNPAMLAVARRHVPTGVQLVCADAHALPYVDAAFDVVFASLCLNETDPRTSFREARRVLRRGGRFCFQDWGPLDPVTAVVNDTLADYATETAHGLQAAMRGLVAAWRPWDAAVQDCEDILALLGAAGFGSARCREVGVPVRIARAETFIDYALAWAPRRAEVAAMSAKARRAFYAALRDRLGGGPLLWEPVLFRVCATV